MRPGFAIFCRTRLAPSVPVGPGTFVESGSGPGCLGRYLCILRIPRNKKPHRKLFDPSYRRKQFSRCQLSAVKDFSSGVRRSEHQVGCDGERVQFSHGMAAKIGREWFFNGAQYFGVERLGVKSIPVLFRPCGRQQIFLCQLILQYLEVADTCGTSA